DLDHLQQVLGHQGGQAQVKGVVPVQAQHLGHVGDVAAVGVAFEVGADVVENFGRREVEAVEAHPGGDAVAQGYVGQLVVLVRAFGGVLGGGLLDQHDLVLVVGGGTGLSALVGHQDGGGAVCAADDLGAGFGLCRKGAEGRHGQRHGRRQQQAEDAFFHNRLLFVHRLLKAGQNMDK